jgi:transketolase
MRKAACSAWCALFREKPFVFLTGDLGFMALEPLRETMGERFINAGVAEQNMVSAAAGLCKTGLDAWVYSIAPFIYARSFEQIRNDVCLNRQPVRLVGNGGGYGYGVQGPTHHAIEDYGVLLSLRGIDAYVPAFADDVGPAISAMASSHRAAYLRLGLCEKPPGYRPAPFQPWRRLLDGDGGILVSVGPLAGPLLAALAAAPASRPELWCLSVLPAGLTEIPEPLTEGLRRGRFLAVVEEHVEHGSAGTALLARLHAAGTPPRRFHHFCARGYPSDTYGSQGFHRRESGLDPIDIACRLTAHGEAT